MWQPFEWVSVKDRLPCAGNGEYQMLICDHFGNVSAAFWNGRLKKFLDEPMGMEMPNITHWSLFPEAPKS